MTEHPPRRGSGSDPWSDPEPPVRLARPMLYQAWRDCSFLHWPVDAAAVRRHIPRSFEVDTFEGRAWVSLISFRIDRMRMAGLPHVPGLVSALESHIRIYVRGSDGRRGIWMVSLDIDPLQAAVLGRFGFALPYWWADMEVSRAADSARYRVRRRAPGAGTLDLDLGLGQPVPETEVSPLEHFVTARWVLYGGVPSVRTAILTEHPRWVFRRATINRLEQTVTKVDGLPPLGDPAMVHFSEGVDARLGWPGPILRREGTSSASAT
ncbi:MAG TPA: DUF2071 domain-containing protein [Actinomycetota bacterium]|nr:DUF2071 domain-containing protein [Actinomycetota bacterium]